MGYEPLYQALQYMVSVRVTSWGVFILSIVLGVVLIAYSTCAVGY